MGKRSLTGTLPQFELRSLPATQLMEEANQSGSTVFIMIETVDALECVDSLAAEPGCDVLMVGCQDLSMEIGTLGEWDHPKFIGALEKVGEAAKKHNKIFGIAGLYTRPDVLERAIKEFGVRWVVGNNDLGLLLSGAKANCELLNSIASR